MIEGPVAICPVSASLAAGDTRHVLLEAYQQSVEAREGRVQPGEPAAGDVVLLVVRPGDGQQVAEEIQRRLCDD